MLSNVQQQWRNFYARKKGYAITWIFTYILTLSLASLIFFYDIPLPNNRLTLSNAEYIATNATQPNDIQQTNWQPISLPHRWGKDEANTNNIWYRSHLKLESAPEQLWAILIPALKMNAAVFLNGKLLNSGGRFDDPVARNWMTPLIFSIPVGLLHQGNNTLHIRLKSDPPGSGQLSAIEVAPYKLLIKSYDTHYMFRIVSIQIITTMLLLTGGLIALLWLLRRKETYYGYYALAVIIWGLHNFNIFIVNIPFSTRFWDWLAFVSIGYYTFFALIFSHRFLQEKHPKIEYPVIIIGTLCSFILLTLNDKLFYFAVYNLWYPAVFGVGFYIFSYISLHAWKQRSIELQFLTAVGGITLLYAKHDLLVMHGYADWQDGYYIQYAAAVLLTLFSFILLRRFVHSLNAIDQLNMTLEKRVQEKHQQLEENYKQLKDMENEHILARERERLTREIHDGMGGHLVSTLAMIESGKADLKAVGEAIKFSLNDLRMMIDSMNIDEDDLPTLLGMFRMRITPRLKNSQLTLHWYIDDIPPIPHFGPREALHVLRILQEAITNIIKHAQADTIHLVTKTIHISPQQTGILIELSDNGIGFNQQPLGNGIKNMQYRAAQIGAQVSLSSDTNGSKVRLTLPV